MKRPGSKARLVQHILPHIAAVDHVCYCEPFCGTCAVLMAKPRSQCEVVNDTDGELVNALRQVQHHPREVLAQLRYVPNARAEFHARRRQHGFTEIQRAATYLYLQYLSFGGDGQSYGVTRSGKESGAAMPRRIVTEQVSALHARLSGVSIEQLDWRRCIALYDSPATLFFCDPPYVGCNVSSYAAWTLPDVQALRSALAQIRGRWIVTLNDSPQVRDIFSGCQFTPIVRGRSMGGPTAKHRGIYRELIITP